MGQPSDTTGGAGHGVKSRSGGASDSAAEGLLSIKFFTCVPLGDQNCVFKYYDHRHLCCAVHTSKTFFFMKSCIKFNLRFSEQYVYDSARVSISPSNSAD